MHKGVDLLENPKLQKESVCEGERVEEDDEYADGLRALCSLYSSSDHYYCPAGTHGCPTECKAPCALY